MRHDNCSKNDVPFKFLVKSLRGKSIKDRPLTLGEDVFFFFFYKSAFLVKEGIKKELLSSHSFVCDDATILTFGAFFNKYSNHQGSSSLSLSLSYQPTNQGSIGGVRYVNDVQILMRKIIICLFKWK